MSSSGEPSTPSPNMDQNQEDVTSTEATRARRQWTPDTYAHRIFRFASRPSGNTLYPGDHYKHIGRFLKLGMSPGAFPGPEERYPFLTLHSVPRSNPTQFMSEVEFEAFTSQNERDHSRSQVLFLKGYPSARWLCYIGAHYDVDPDIFYRHFSFSTPTESSELHCIPPLPSSVDTIQLRITSLGVWDNTKSGIAIDQIRKEAETEMEGYMKDLTNNRLVSIGDSIVRRFSIHDDRTFTLEQAITISIIQRGDKWTALVWSDIGKDLGSNGSGPWTTIRRNHASTMRLLPIIQDRARIALNKSRDRQEDSAIGDMPQNLSRIPVEFGRYLKADAMEHDPFYSLTEIFLLVVASENQFLNFMKRKINATSAIGARRHRRITDLQSSKALIDDHIERISDELGIVKRHTTLHRGRTNPTLATTEETTAKLIKDFEHLLSVAETLSRKCKDNIGMMMNEAMYDESQKAIQQAKSLAKLTVLAFFFVPLSFTTSFFGMNFLELAEGSLRLWLWFAVSVPLLIGSFMVLYMDISRASSRLQRFLSLEEREYRERT